MAGDRTNAGIARDIAAAARRNARLIGSLDTSVAELAAEVDAIPGGSPPIVLNIDFGATPRDSGSFTFATAISTIGSIVEIFETAETIAATGEEADRLECDRVMATGRITADTTATIWWMSTPGPISGIRRFFYRITSI